MRTQGVPLGRKAVQAMQYQKLSYEDMMSKTCMKLAMYMLWFQLCVRQVTTPFTVSSEKYKFSIRQLHQSKACACDQVLKKTNKKQQQMNKQQQ